MTLADTRSVAVIRYRTRRRFVCTAPGKTTVNIGYGHFAGENAIGGTIVHRLKPWFKGADRFMLNAGVGYGFSGDDPVIRAGATFEF